MNVDFDNSVGDKAFAWLTDNEVSVPTGQLELDVYFKSGGSTLRAFNTLGHPTTDELPYDLYPVIGAAHNGSASSAKQFVGLIGGPDERQYRCVYSAEPVVGLENSGRLSDSDVEIVGLRYRPGFRCLSDRLEADAVNTYLGWRSPERVTVIGPVHAWLPEVLQRLGFLLSLPPEWDSHRATRVSEQLAANVLRFLQEVMRPETAPPSVVPLEDGGLQIEWHTGGMDVEIEFEPSEPLEIYIRDIQTGDEHEGDAVELFKSFALADRLR
jgi:hypothetical protein